MSKKTALISDFDGTVSDSDFFWKVVDKYMDEAALEPWRMYLAGRLTHFEALKRIFSQIRVPEADLRNFIQEIKIDSHFQETAGICQSQGIPFYICSAGCDYYIKILIGGIIDCYGINLVANHGTYTPQNGLEMSAPAGRFYDAAVGVSKKAVVEFLQGQGYRVIYAGDGLPDVAAAQVADVVFARDMLLEKCRKQKIPCKKLNSFADICQYLLKEEG